MRGMSSLAILMALLTSVACGGPVEEGPQAASAPAPLTDEQLFEAAKVRFRPLPDLAANDDNPLTAVKVELGKTLYFETLLSKDGTISCNSCHDLESYGVDNLAFSPGDTGEFGGRNSPTVLNAALNNSQFWDGRAKDVEEQAGMPILNPVEMAIPDEQFLVDRLAQTEKYPALFAEAFPEEESPLTYRNISRALGAFERTLLTPSRFDEYLNGEQEALTGQEKAGLAQFVTIGCTTCHNGVNVGATSFQKFGVHGDYWEATGSANVDEGRFEVTGADDDKYVFRVPTLRNVEMTGPYFHDGSVGELEAAIKMMGRLQLGLELTDEQVGDIAAFLRSLTGELPSEVSATAS